MEFSNDIFTFCENGVSITEASFDSVLLKAASILILDYDDFDHNYVYDSFREFCPGNVGSMDSMRILLSKVLIFGIIRSLHALANYCGYFSAKLIL